MPVTRTETSLARPVPTSLEILETAIRGGVTSENVAVVKEIIAMRREELAFENKAKFNRAFFALKQEISTSDFYADKAAKTDSGAVAFTYCSERELQTKLDPILARHGFAMLFGQRDEGEKTVAIITLIHQDGHEENREYAVRSGGTNRLKDATAADTGATTSAWRHLVIKMFGLKSRIVDDNDAKNLGGHITKEQAADIRRRVMDTGSDEAAFLRFAGATSYETICEGKFGTLDATLRRKERVS